MFIVEKSRRRRQNEESISSSSTSEYAEDNYSDGVAVDIETVRELIDAAIDSFEMKIFSNMTIYRDDAIRYTQGKPSSFVLVIIN